MIQNQQVRTALDGLHAQAARDLPQMLKGLGKGVFRKLKPEDMRHSFMAIGRDEGEYLYRRNLREGHRNIVEYGTSFGVSTIYLAAAARQNGGKVITTELLADKAEIARQNFETAALADCIDLRVGDAMQTLSNLQEPVDFLFLDGWAELNIPLLEMLEPQFTPGAVVVLDNANFPSSRSTKAFLQQSPRFSTEPYARGQRSFTAIFQ